jgi:hypothetical protein
MRALLLLPFTLPLALNASCLRQTEFNCATNAQCGPSGTCQLVGASVGYCSFPDSECGQRFGESAGPYANQCVGMQGGGDGSITIDARMIDGAPVSGCPASYTALPNAPTNTHRYMRVPQDKNWNEQVAFCMQTSPATAYLAIPNDAEELTALFTLAGNAPFWIGISDTATEGTFVTVRGATATFLPFAVPPDGGTTENCVAATGTNFSDEKCTGGGSNRPAVCECEP